MKTYRIFLPVILAATALAALPAAAQESDDFDFARRLAYRGWFDLATVVSNRIQNDGNVPRETRSALPILLAEIELAKAERESDAEKSRKHVDDSIALLEKFLKEEPNHPRNLDAQINIGWLKARKAKGLVEQLERSSTPQDVERLRAEAAALYGDVAREFTAIVDNCRKRTPRNPEDKEIIDGAIIDARLEIPRAMFDRARIPGLPEEERRTLLADAAKLLEDYEFDYGNIGKGFEAMLLRGRCLVELGDWVPAEVKLKSTLALIDILAREKMVRTPYHNNIIFNAYLTLAQLYVRSGRPGDAKRFIESTLKSDPTVAPDWIGPALKVELVDALFKLKDFTNANAIAQEVIKADPNSFYAGKMREKVRSAGGSAGAKLPPDQCINVADGHMDRNRFRDAMVALRQAIEGSTSEADQAKWAPEAWYRMGQCLQELKRHYEAAVAYEKVFTLQPKHEKAAKACFSASLCYGLEFETSGDKRDEEAADRFQAKLLDWPNDPVSKNVRYVQAYKLQQAGKLKEAADLYAQVPADAEAYERSLVRGAYCLRVEASQQWAKNAKDPAVQKAVRDQLQRAEGIFKKFLDWTRDHPAADAEAVKDRESLKLVANQELAYIYIHDSIGRAEECLKFLEQVAKDIPPSDERMAKLLEIQVRAHLALNQVDPAVKTLELMFERFQDHAATAQSCKSVAIRLDEITADLLAGKGGVKPDPKVIEENLKKISKYYAKWLEGAMSFNLKATTGDVRAVAETLYMIAKRLNDLPDTVTSFLDLKGKYIIAWRKYFEDAAFVHKLLIGREDPKPTKERLLLMMRLARCYSFVADQTPDWVDAQRAYEEIVKSFEIVNSKGEMNIPALQKFPELLSVYLELGHVYAELGRKGAKIQYDNALNVFFNVAAVAPLTGEAWWVS
ncbi:MAG TPA: tetratricopeptide repeat protein, partial [Planctomycetota bacterium]|nr:tetratricopeptide repeat protein [Planctomycetota bacterium]